MWKRLTLLLSLLFASTAIAQPAFVTGQQFNSHRNATNPSNALSFPVSLTAGNTIVCAIHLESGVDTVTAVSDTSGDAFQIAGSHCPTDAASRTLTVWYATNIAGGNTGAIQITRASASQLDVICAEYSGVKTTSPVDATNCGTFADDPTATVTTSQAGDLLFSFVVNNGGAATSPTGYTSRAASSFNLFYQLSDKIGAGAGSESSQYITVTTSTGGVFLAAFKDTSAAVSTPKRQLLLRAG